MATRRVTPPWDYLHEASGPSLESFELSRLNHAANLRKEIAALLEQWIEEGPRPSWRAGCARTTNCPSNRTSESMFFRKSKLPRLQRLQRSPWPCVHASPSVAFGLRAALPLRIEAPAAR